MHGSHEDEGCVDQSEMGLYIKYFTNLIKPPGSGNGFDCIMGYDATKAKLKTLTPDHALKYKDFYDAIPEHILLIGPPGCGKTKLITAYGVESGYNVIKVCPSDIDSRYTGEPEKRINALFQVARANLPCIIFIDEVDQLFGCRMGRQLQQGLTTEFLNMFGGEDAEKENLIVAGATNLPWMMDPSAFRRFGTRLYIGLPNRLARSNIFKMSYGDGYKSIVDMDWKTFGAMTIGYTSDDIWKLGKECTRIPINKLQSAKAFKKIEGSEIKLLPCQVNDPKALLGVYTDFPVDLLAKPTVAYDDIFNVIKIRKPSIPVNWKKLSEEAAANFGRHKLPIVEMMYNLENFSRSNDIVDLEKLARDEELAIQLEKAKEELVMKIFNDAERKRRRKEQEEECEKIRAMQKMEIERQRLQREKELISIVQRATVKGNKETKNDKCVIV